MMSLRCHPLNQIYPYPFTGPLSPRPAATLFRPPRWLPPPTGCFLRLRPSLLPSCNPSFLALLPCIPLLLLHFLAVADSALCQSKSAVGCPGQLRKSVARRAPFCLTLRLPSFESGHDQNRGHRSSPERQTWTSARTTGPQSLPSGKESRAPFSVSRGSSPQVHNDPVPLPIVCPSCVVEPCKNFGPGVAPKGLFKVPL